MEIYPNISVEYEAVTDYEESDFPPHAVKDNVITAAIPSAMSFFNFIDETSL